MLNLATLDAVYFSSERKRKSYPSYSRKRWVFVSDSSGNILSEHPIYSELDEDILEDQN